MEENNWLARTALLLGPAQVDMLAHKHVLQVGLGGVGTISYMPAVFGCIAASVVIRELCGMTLQ